jgi:effector-binding domain-containing protein
MRLGAYLDVLQGYTLGAERYLNNPADTAPEELLTEIYIPVE